MLEEMALSPEDDQKQKLVFDLVTNFSKLEIGAEPIWERIKQSVNSSKVVTRFLRRCAAVDEEYGKNLMKCVNTTLKEIEKEESQNGTFSDSMNEILKLHEEIAKSKIRLASHTYSIAEELAYVAKEKDTLRKMQRETGTKIKKTLMDGEYNLEKIKGRYLQATETWEKAILTRIEQSQMELEQPIQNQIPSKPHNPIMEAINNIFTQPRSVDSLKKAEEEAKTKAVNAKRLYSQNVNVLNHIKHEYYNQQLPDLIKESVSCVEESDKACKVYLDLFANRSMAGYSEVNNLIANEEKGLNKLIQKIDFHQDNLEYFAKFLKNQPANRDPFSMLDYSMSPLAQSALNPKVVYGVDLIKLAERDNLDIPIMVEKCISYIEDKGITFEGIYRRSGASTKINRLKELFNLNSENVDLENLEIAQDVDSVTGALKLFLRELPNATVPSNYWSQFYTAYKLENSSHEEKVYAYLQAINNLPVPHMNLLRKLVMHLKKVSQYENENKMTVSNLAIVFGPTLFEPAYNSNAVETMGFQCGVTMDLLNFEELLFED
ncbi:RhoGAP-domain-containing protein [Neoconidiobolus thromboides FSU 785]|nr:RhoGAP-domain-containing protein [Neoconidiobolus thromboides FSU 785]